MCIRDSALPHAIDPPDPHVDCCGAQLGGATKHMGNIGSCARDSRGGSLVHHSVRPFASARQVMKQRGFTLAELAIVVTVIGFLIFAVLKGQSLIGQAKAKDVIAIVDGLRNSTTFFRQRYSCLLYTSIFPVRL